MRNLHTSSSYFISLPPSTWTPIPSINTMTTPSAALPASNSRSSSTMPFPNSDEERRHLQTAPTDSIMTSQDPTSTGDAAPSISTDQTAGSSPGIEPIQREKTSSGSHDPQQRRQPSPPGPRPELAPWGPPGRPLSILREIVGVGILVCSMLVTQSGLGQVIVPLTNIADTFGVTESPGRQSWFAAAFSLSVGTIILPAGRAGDMIGHKRVIVFGFAWASLWSLLCGISSYSRSDIFFDFCRAMQGMGFSILLPNSVAILSRCTHADHWRRPLYFTVFAASAPNGFLLGAVFSSLFTQLRGTWEWGFYLSTICLAGLTVAAAFVLPSDSYLIHFHRHSEKPAEGDTASTAPEAEAKFDYLGTLLAVSGLVLINFAWNQAGVVGWQVAYNPVLLVVGIALVAAFLYVETRVAHPLIPTDIWTPRNSIVLGCVALGWSSFGIWSFYSVRWWITLRGATLLSATAMATPCGVAGCLAAVTSIFLLRHAGPSWVMFLALAAFMTANALIASQPIQQLYWKQSFPSWCIAPFGMDMSFPSASLIIAGTLPPQKQGVAGSLVNTIINYSVALGLGIAGTVESQVNDGGRDVYAGYRGALFLGTGLAGLGVVLALADIVVSSVRRRSNASRAASQPAAGDEERQARSRLNSEKDAKSIAGA